MELTAYKSLQERTDANMQTLGMLGSHIHNFNKIEDQMQTNTPLQTFIVQKKANMGNNNPLLEKRRNSIRQFLIENMQKINDLKTTILGGKINVDNIKPCLKSKANVNRSHAHHLTSGMYNQQGVKVKTVSSAEKSSINISPKMLMIDEEFNVNINRPFPYQRIEEIKKSSKESHKQEEEKKETKKSGMNSVQSSENLIERVMTHQSVGDEKENLLNSSLRKNEVIIRNLTCKNPEVRKVWNQEISQSSEEDLGGFRQCQEISPPENSYSTTFLDNERDLLKLKNVFDSLSEEDADQFEDLESFFILNPESTFKFFWEFVSCFFILYSMIFTPYHLVFDNNDTGFFFQMDLIIDFFFLVDIILNFFTAYYKEDTLVTNLSSIALSYIQSWLFLDVISSFPFGLIEVFSSGTGKTTIGEFNMNSFKKIARIYRLIKWFRVFRIVKLRKNNLWKKVEGLLVSEYLKYTLGFLIMLHLVTCMWCFIAKLEVMMLIDINWITESRLSDASDIEIYFASLYFNLTTIFTIGYGDISAHTQIEYFYMLFFMTIGCLIWTFTLSAFSHLFSMSDQRTIVLNAKLKQLAELKHALKEKLPDGTVEKIKKSLLHEYKKYNKDRLYLLDSLPGNMRNKLFLIIYAQQISNLQFFQDQSYDFIVAALPMIQSVHYDRNDDEYILKIGNIAEEIYMVDKGTLSLHLGSYYQHFEIAQIKSNYHIGDILIYTNDQSPYDIKVKSSFVDLLVLKKESFAQLKLGFKEAVEKILAKSHVIYARIEEKKEIAIDYFGRFHSFDGFENEYLKVIRGADKEKDSMKSLQEFATLVKDEIELQKEIEDCRLKEEEEMSMYSQNDEIMTSNTSTYHKLSILHPISISSKSNSIVSSVGNNELPTGNASSCLTFSTPQLAKHSLMSLKNPTRHKLSTPVMNMKRYSHSPTNLGNVNSNNNNNKIVVINNLSIKYQYGKDSQCKQVHTPQLKSKQYMRAMTSDVEGDSCSNSYSNSNTPSMAERKLEYRKLNTLSSMNSIGSPVMSPSQREFFAKFAEKRKSLKKGRAASTKKFLDNLNDRIEHNGILYKNNEIMQYYLKDFIEAGKDEGQKMKLIMGKLEKLEGKLRILRSLRK